MSAGVHSRDSMSEPNPFPALCSKWYRLMSVLRRSSTLPGSDIGMRADVVLFNSWNTLSGRCRSHPKAKAYGFSRSPN
jgi:hypothetical protein